MCRRPPGGIMCVGIAPARERPVGKGEEEAPVSDEEKNKALTRWWWEEVWVRGNLAAMDDFMAPNYADHPNLPGLPPGPEGMKQVLTYWLAGSPRPAPSTSSPRTTGWPCAGVLAAPTWESG